MKRVTPVLLGLALLVAFNAAVRSAEPERRRPEKVGRWPRLSLLKVEKGAITVKEGRGDDKAGPQEYKVATDAKTRVRIGEEEARKKEDGTTRTRVMLRPGSLADLKVGQTVVVMALDGIATEIHIMPPTPPEKQPEKK
jgi:hypothetical protein